MKIGQLAARTGLSRDTIRYYEKRELLVAESRDTTSQYKLYGQAGLDRLLHIQRLKDVGFTLSEIRHLLERDGNSCEDLPNQLAKKLAKIDAQIETLLAFKTSLLEVQRSCAGDCAKQNGMPICIPSVMPQSVQCC